MQGALRTHALAPLQRSGAALSQPEAKSPSSTATLVADTLCTSSAVASSSEMKRAAVQKHQQAFGATALTAEELPPEHRAYMLEPVQNEVESLRLQMLELRTRVDNIGSVAQTQYQKHQEMVQQVDRLSRSHTMSETYWREQLAQVREEHRAQSAQLFEDLKLFSHLSAKAACEANQESLLEKFHLGSKSDNAWYEQCQTSLGLRLHKLDMKLQIEFAHLREESGHSLKDLQDQCEASLASKESSLRSHVMEALQVESLRRDSASAAVQDMMQRIGAELQDKVRDADCRRQAEQDELQFSISNQLRNLMQYVDHGHDEDGVLGLRRLQDDLVQTKTEWLARHEEFQRSWRNSMGLLLPQTVDAFDQSTLWRQVRADDRPCDLDAVSGGLNRGSSCRA